MLLQLNINNFALIESLSISFESGLNILSGETGAGKSILIDAINYVLGVKFSKNFIRTGENKTNVEAVFSIENDATKEILKSLEIEFDDIIIINREAFLSGKSIAKINGKTVLLTHLKELSSALIDIHGQHENQSLMNWENHRSVLDNYGEHKLRNLKNQYLDEYLKLKNLTEKIDELIKKSKDRERNIDFLKYQIDEIDKAKLSKGEDTELEEKYILVSNSETIKKILSESYEKLYNGNEGVTSIFDSFSIIIKEMRTIEKHSEKIKNICDSLEEIYYNLEQNIYSIRDMKDSIDFDERELEQINERIYLINSLKKKYGKEIEQILQYRDKSLKEYNELVEYTDTLNSLQEQKEKLHIKVIELSQKLYNIRKEIAKVLEKEINEELKYIGLEKSLFKIDVQYDEDKINENGADIIQFLISTNPGEPIKPLIKIVSGGELSRIMLAIKTVFVHKDNIPSVIFDEIDTGISGRIAQAVAEKMYVISKKHQVFCVTHLPQIASMSDVHYLVSKQSADDKTCTTVARLSNLEKEKAIAIMLGGSEVTKLTYEHAREMIDIANEKKKVLQKNP